MDSVDAVARYDGYYYVLDSLKPVLRALAHGKRIQVFEGDNREPVIDFRVRDGWKGANFLRRCSDV